MFNLKLLKAFFKGLLTFKFLYMQANLKITALQSPDQSLVC